MKSCHLLISSLLSTLFLSCTACAWAGEVRVAVATNFMSLLDNELRPLYEQQSGHHLRISSGSTGSLYAHIINGAGFDIFLAADEERPILLEQNRIGVAGSRFTYAMGKLVLWSPNSFLFTETGFDILQRGDFRSLAIANPALAPYGRAARQAMEALEIWDSVKGKVVLGENIGQAYAMIATGNAQLGFIALSLLPPGESAQGSLWAIPEALYDPIRQQGILLETAENNAAALSFIDFLKSPEARSIISHFGYNLD